MDAPHWLSLFTSAGMLALGVVCILRLRASRLAVPLAVLCLLCFAVRFAGWVQALDAPSSWPYFVRPIYPWIPAVALHVVLTFVGLGHSLRLLQRAGYGVAALLSVFAALGFGSQQLAHWARSDAFLALVALEMFGCAACALWLLLRHYQLQDDAAELLRTKMMLAVSALCLVLPLVPYFLPRSHLLLAVIMSLLLVLLTAVTFGGQLLETELEGLSFVYVCALLVIAVGASLIASSWLAHLWWPYVLLAGGAGLLCLVALLWQVGSALMVQHARTTQLALLGRLSTNMAHDLKNPLAALKGAAQFLQEERAQGRSIDEQDQLLALLVAESDRLARFVERYQQTGGPVAVKEPTSLNQLVQRAVQVLRATAPASLSFHTELAPTLPACALDPQLLMAALENLLRNAVEATPPEGSITVRTREQRHASTSSVAVIVEDTGSGMTPRALALAFREPFSSKARGRGLGLSLVRNAVDAHGGQVRARSRLGRGTTIEMSFPVS